MTTGLFVAWNPIKQAVKGHETGVLASLGVSWNTSGSHIHCPYANHEDRNPSWRWDETKAKARCTCIERSHSIFDVVMHIEGIDFDAAKLRVAEFIGRQDLIKTKDGKRYQAMDAVSLLRPSDDQRDEKLTKAYLGYRLDIPPDQVPMPTTPVTAWRSLPYFDPPVSKKAKPKCIAHHPCLIFGTLSSDGRCHAHRIYVALDGQGKAELGTADNGKPRDPKKSATCRPGQSASGCSVLWGDPAKAPHLILVEGIETGTAVAHVHLSEVEAGEVAVAAALSTSGIRSLQPWPVTQRVTVAADRDEDKSDGDRGFKAGEKAARVFAVRHHSELEIRIALPGNSGEGIDWLDILRRDDIGAVREGIENAAPFTPTHHELKSEKRRIVDEAELNKIERLYPLPAMETMRLEYRRTDSGKVMVHKYVGKDDDGADLWIPIATPVGVPARLRYVDQQGTYGLRVVVQGMNGDPTPIDFDRATLARMGASEIRALLFGAGLRVESEGEAVAVQVLKAADPTAEVRIVSRPGWHRVSGLVDPIFVTPHGAIIGAPKECPLELAVAAGMAEVAVAGTLQGWQEAIAAASELENCPHFTLGTISSFVGPIQGLAVFESCGYSATGLSSAGKTLSLRLAASAWSSPRIGSGLLQSLRTTENAVESIAQAASDTVLALDEAAHIDGKTLGRMIYSLASGQGKLRLSADAILKSSYRWTTFIMLSSERSLEESVRADNGQWMAGMAVRVLDVDVTHVNRSVSRDVLDRIDGVLSHHGHAGPAFVRCLIEHGYHRRPEELRQTVLDAARRIAGKDADSMRVRAATVFGLLFVAGGLAKEFGILPPTADVEGAVKWGWQQFDNSSDARALKPDEQIISNLTTWVAQRWDVTIKPVKPSPDSYGNTRTNNREAEGWYDGDIVYLPTSIIAKAAGSTLKETEIARVLEAKRYLSKRGGNDRLAVGYVPSIGKAQCYALSREHFGWGSHASDTEFAVVNGGRS